MERESRGINTDDEEFYSNVNRQVLRRVEAIKLWNNVKSLKTLLILCFDDIVGTLLNGGGLLHLYIFSISGRELSKPTDTDVKILYAGM